MPSNPRIHVPQNPDAVSWQNGKGKTPLHFAAREGRLEVVNFLLDRAPQVAAILTDKRKLPLHFAAADGHSHVCRRLLEVYPEGARVSSSKGKNCLHFCARWGHLGIARDVLDLYPDAICTPDAEFSLPLHDAVRGSQVDMCRMLVDRYPMAVTACNMRGEIPLYGAARSGNLELCAYFVAVWPRSGAYLLQNASVDDCIGEWDWDVLEMLLRGAVGNFAGCSLFGNRLPPPHVRINNETAVANVHEDTLTRARSPNVQTPTALPVLEKEDEEEPPLKRPKLEDAPTCSWDHDLITCGCPRSLNHQPPEGKAGSTKFLPLHAAFRAKVSRVVLEHIWTACRDQVEDVDEYGRTALHWAATYRKTFPTIMEMLEVYPKAAFTRDLQGRLPLHVAVANGAPVLLPLIKALLTVNPESGIQPCKTRDEWHDRRPLDLACHYNASLNVVFHLLCGDPSFVSRNRDS